MSDEQICNDHYFPDAISGTALAFRRAARALRIKTKKAEVRSENALGHRGYNSVEVLTSDRSLGEAAAADISDEAQEVVLKINEGRV